MASQNSVEGYISNFTFPFHWGGRLKSVSKSPQAINVLIQHHHHLSPLNQYITFSILSESGIAEWLQPVGSGQQHFCDHFTALL